MKIQELFQKYSEFKLFRLLSRNDNEKIVRFFNQTPMQTTALRLRYERLPNFFTFLNFQSEKYFVVGADKDEKDIKLVASFSVREGYVNQKKSRVAYLGDLRAKGGISFSRKWQNAYGVLMQNSHLLEDAGFDYAITAIMGGNKKAIKALVKNPKSNFFYYKLCDYYMVNLIMPYKRIANIGKINIFRATISDKEDVLNFLEDQYKNKLFGYTKDFILRAFETWPDFEISNFIIVKDRSTIIGVTATWNPSPAKKIVVESLPKKLKILNKIISPFTKTSKVGEELKVQYLNFLNIKESSAFSKHKVLSFIIEYLRQEGAFKEFDIVSFGDFGPNYYYKNIKNIVKEITPLELYQVVHESDQSKLLNQYNQSLSFEISLV